MLYQKMVLLYVGQTTQEGSGMKLYYASQKFSSFFDFRPLF